MFSFRTKSTGTLWQMSDKQKLYMKITNITNKTIKELYEFVMRHDLSAKEKIEFRQMSGIASNINGFLNNVFKNNAVDCYQIADVINGYIEKHDTSKLNFYGEIAKAINPYLTKCVGEESEIIKPCNKGDWVSLFAGLGV